MADVPQTIVEPVKGEGGFGRSNHTNLQAAFPGSPILSEEMSDDERKEYYNALLTGEQGPGHGVTEFNPDYSANGSPDIPNLSEVKGPNGSVLPIGQGAGAPTTPYVPPLTSPGEGNFTASEQPAYTGSPPLEGTEYGSGMNASSASPKNTSEGIEGLRLPTTADSSGALVEGSSYNGSDGTS